MDDDTAELVHAADRRAGIVDRGRDCAQPDIGDLDDAELDILLHRARRTDIEGGDEMDARVPAARAPASTHDKRNAGRHELPDAARQVHADALGLARATSWPILMKRM